MFHAPALRLTIAAASLVAALGLPTTAAAVPTLNFDASGLLVGIDQLTVGDNTFNVSWQADLSYDTVYAATPPAALGNRPLADAVAGAISQAFLAAAPLTTGQNWWAPDTDCSNRCFLWIPSRYHDNGFGWIAEGSAVTFAYDTTTQTWSSQTGSFGAVASLGFPWDAYAVFAVPEPASAALLALGVGALAGLLAVRRQNAFTPRSSRAS